MQSFHPLVATANRRKRRTKYEAFKPSFTPKEKLSYNLYWKGLKVGSFDFRTGEKPPEGGKYRYYFNSKSNRFGKWFFRFFSTTASSVQSPEDGSSSEFFRHLARDERFLQERVKFEYQYKRVKQIISKVRGSRPKERIRLIEHKMIDPIIMFYHLRSKKFKKKGEKRTYLLFADDFFNVEMEVLNQKEKEYSEIKKRKIWTVKCSVPKSTITFKTGTFLLEIDVSTGIILSMFWDDDSGKCKALLRKAINSPLPFEAGFER